MDVINHFHLPENMPEVSLLHFILLIAIALIIMTIVASLSAFIVNAPRSSVFRAFFAVILHLILTTTVMLILFYINKPPSLEIILAITFATGIQAYATCFATPIPKGGLITLITFVLYFLSYKCTSLYLQSEYMDFYKENMNIITDLLEQYETYRY